MRPGILLIMFLTILTVSGTSCKRNRYRINTSHINVSVSVTRLEKDLFTADPGRLPELVPGLKARYGSFLQLFSYVINTGNVNDPSFPDFLVRFCTDKLNNEVYADVMKRFPDTDQLQKGLEDAFRHYRYYFPGRKIPAVYTCITGFNNSIISGDSVLGISLDRYLGAGCDYYKRLHIYKYLSDRMTPEYIVPDCVYGWVMSEWPFDSAGYKADNVLAEMIHEGKLKYLEKCLLPEASDELIFGFSTEQLKFCRNNESQMWQYMVEHNLLFITEQFSIRKLTGEAPFTSFFTNESPGRAAVWMGFRIVEAFVINSGIKPEELMKKTDIQDILQKARYSPK